MPNQLSYAGLAKCLHPSFHPDLDSLAESGLRRQLLEIFYDATCLITLKEELSMGGAVERRYSLQTELDETDSR